MARISSSNRHDHQQDAGDCQSLHRRRVRIDHLVIDVVRQRVGDGEQEAIRGRERGGKTAGRDQTGDHVRQTGNFRCRQHDHVGVDHEVLQADDTSTGSLTRIDHGLKAGGILAADLDQTEFAPGEHPGTNL
jgi:hypothetical protein